ncbi:hypothetical protein GBF38_002583, partial [Nibea albiflora]
MSTSLAYLAPVLAQHRLCSTSISTRSPGLSIRKLCKSQRVEALEEKCIV